MAFDSWAGAQVFLDLCVSLCIALRWLVADAKKAGHNPWPWVALTLPLGSLSPLAYWVATRTIWRTAGSESVLNEAASA